MRYEERGYITKREGRLPAVPISPMSTKSKNTGLRRMTISMGC